MRYTLLETVRQYALERLEAAGELDAMRDRQLAWCLHLAEAADPDLVGPRMPWWVEQLEREHDNLRATLHWAYQRGAVMPGLRLAGALGRFWLARSHMREGREWLERLLALPASTTSDYRAVRAKALHMAGALAAQQGDLAPAGVLCEESLAMQQALGDKGDKAGMATTFLTLGNIARMHGEFARAGALLEEGLTLARTLRNTALVVNFLNSLGTVAQELGDVRQATVRYEECLALWQGMQHAWGIAAALGNLATAVLDQGDPERAIALGQDSLARFRALEDRVAVANVLCTLSASMRERGQRARAASLADESLALSRDLGDRWGTAAALSELGDVVRDQGDHARAAALYEDSLALYREVGDRRGEARALCNLGRIAHRQGDDPRALALYEQGLPRYQAVGDKKGMAVCAEQAARTLVRLDHPVRAAQFLGTAEALRAATGAARLPSDRAGCDQDIAALRLTLGDGFAAAWSEGQTWPLEQGALDLLMLS
jgi:tetratricopeptide (TPR) repeat protein